METTEVQKIIEAGINDSEVIVTADGNKYTAIVISDEFEGKTMVAEQKMVYALMNEHIQSGAVHALTSAPDLVGFHLFIGDLLKAFLDQIDPCLLHVLA